MQAHSSLCRPDALYFRCGVDAVEKGVEERNEQ